MYKQISIKNLKIFKDEQKLKIAPITLLYGENSSGKTSLLKTFDIVHNIFSEQQVKRGKNIGQKDSPFYRNENIQNISAKNIHFYSNQFNKKDINISILLDVITNNQNIKETVLESLKNMAMAADLGRKGIVKYHSSGTRLAGYMHMPLKVNLNIKYFPKKEISKVVEIDVQKKGGKSLINFSRINKEYKKLEGLFDKNKVGYLSPGFNRKLNRPNRFSAVYHRGRPIAEEDYFVDDVFYADYKINIKDKLIWRNIYNNYEKIFSENEKIKSRYKKIKIITKALFDFKDHILKSQKNFSNTKIDYETFAYFVAKYVLSGDIPKIFSSGYKIKNHNFKPRFSSIENIINSLNNKGDCEEIKKIVSKHYKKFNRLTVLGLSEHNVSCPKCGLKYEVDVDVVPKKGKNLQCNLCKNTWYFKAKKKNKFNKKDKLFLREFLLARKISRSNYINGILLKRIIEKKEKNLSNFIKSAELDLSLFNMRFFKTSPDIRFDLIRENGHSSETTFDLISLLSDYICNDLDPMFYEYWVTEKFNLPAFKREPITNILKTCVSEIRNTVNNFVICHPSKTNIDWHVARKTDFPKGVLETIRKARAEETKDDIFKGRAILEKQDEEIRKMAIIKRSKAMKRRILENIDSAKIHADGRNFHSTIISNEKLRLRLNKTLKDLLGLEIKVVTPKFLKEFLKSKEKYKMLRNAQRHGLMYPTGVGRYSRTKYIIIRDLKFKKSFEIHGEEIGKGPSNILPFIAQILSKKPSLTYIIQELENNWHPKYQSAIVQLMANKMKESQKDWGDYLNKNFILETHSELFVLQIQKLVEKGVLNPEDVSINFIKRNKEGNSEIHNLPLNSKGGFEKAWPDGFFNERMEILSS